MNSNFELVWEQTHVGTRNGVVVLYSSHKMIVIVVVVAIAVVKVTVAAPAVVASPAYSA